MKRIKRSLVGIGLGLIFASVGFAEGEKNVTKSAKRGQERVEIKINSWGLSAAETDAAVARVERSAEVQSRLTGTRYRFLESSYIENEDKSKVTQIPNRFRAVFYDYTNDRVIIAESSFDNQSAVTVREEFYQPNPNNEEFDEAVRLLQKDTRFGGQLRSETLKSFRPMPPVTVLDGTNERLINVGLQSFGEAATTEIVAVRIKDGQVIRYPNGAPESSREAVAPDACGITNANQNPTGRGLQGQYQMTISQGQSPLWEMLVIRPSASSGTRASGLEVRDVKYKGKSVLKRGHVPVLNVLYDGNACGPYRDWQYSEDSFNAPAAGATNPAAGIRLLAEGQIATTSIESGTDTGNFQGVAVYRQNNETVLVTELDASWYRYIMEWRFADDGTIRPRFGFGATNSGCVCNIHNHHAYWRFDFDVVNPNNKVFQVERGRKFLQPLTTEVTRVKSLQTNRSLLIQNSTGNEAYMLVPNKTDGTVDTYGRSDMWVLRAKNVVGGTVLQNEIDDGYNNTSGSGTPINIGTFMNNESIVDQDVVVWYGAHFVHADGANLMEPSRSPTILSGTHVVGPDIRPVQW